MRKLVVACVLAQCATGLRLSPVPLAASCHQYRCAAPLMLSKKKGKGNKSAVSKAADKALAALDALESQSIDAMAAEGRPAKMGSGAKAAAKKAAKVGAAVDSDPLAVPVPDGMMMPAVPGPIKKNMNNKAEAEAEAEAAPVAPAAPPAPKTLTMAEEVALICGELGLDAGQPVIKAVGAANEAMGLEAEGPLAQQVEALMEQL
eukprot:2049449-Prymnesium_polylepis.1